MPEQLVAADSANRKALEALARSHVSLSDVLVKSALLDDAVESLKHGIGVYQRMLEGNPGNSEIVNYLGNSQRKLCKVLTEGTRPAEALEWCLAAEHALELAVRMVQGNPVVRANLGLCLRPHRAGVSRPVPRRPHPRSGPIPPVCGGSLWRCAGNPSCHRSDASGSGVLAGLGSR